jgi:DNA helicase-4
MPLEPPLLKSPQAFLVQSFFTKKIELDEPESDRAFQEFCSQAGLPKTSMLYAALSKIHLAWNSGTFVGFSDHLELDSVIRQKSDMQANVLISPNFFARAQKRLSEKLKDDTYRQRFSSYQDDLRKAGGYEQILKHREALKLEALRKKEEARQQRRELIQSYFPEAWNLSAFQISTMIGQSISSDQIEELKITIVKEWLSERNLGTPSEEQAVVIANCHNSLKVVARAGSGKTRTIAQKILFLVYYLGYSPDQIIALAFNDNAVKELGFRLDTYRKQAGLPDIGRFKILTFDALARNLVNPEEKILNDIQQKGIINKLVLNALDNEENLQAEVERLLIASFKNDWERIVRYDSLSFPVYLQQFRRSLTERTLDDKEVKSKAEKRIGDFLFEHDIPYLYEMPFSVDDGHVIRPDFYLPAHKVVLEYYGLLGDAEYEKSIGYKREYWRTRPDITLIEINPGVICQEGLNFDDSREQDYRFLFNLLTERTKHLHKRIQPRRLSNEEIVSRLRERVKLEFVDLLQNAISRAGQIDCSDEELIRRLSIYQPVTSEEEAFLSLMPRFLMMYKDQLANHAPALTDFSQVKKAAISAIHAGKTEFDWNRGQDTINLKFVKYIFVDEFQDFSELFRGLLLAILKVATDAVVNAVGDDWQMINRFAGSKPELFNQFETDYPKPRTVYLQTNYRSSAGIVDLCNAIMKANGVLGKPAIPCDAMKNKYFRIGSLALDQLRPTPRESHHFKGDSLLSAVFRLLKPISAKSLGSERDDGDKICLVISRTNDPPLRIGAGNLRIRASNNREMINKIVDRLTPPAIGRSFEAITGHKSKGLEADAVIVLQPRQFPMIHARSTFLRFFGDDLQNLLRDELNIFYVACSRAKRELYFLPNSQYMTSVFLKALSGSVANYEWDLFPCRLNNPSALHVIMIQTANRDLYLPRDLLSAYGFTKFSRPNKIVTMSTVIRADLYAALCLLERVQCACSGFDLRYTIRDGLNRDVFSLPGPKTIAEAIAESRSTQ